MYNHPYNQKVQRELELWERRVTKKPSSIKRSGTTLQKIVAKHTPETVHRTITESMRILIQAILLGTYKPLNRGKGKYKLSSLEQKDEELLQLQKKYQKLGAVEGAGTGFGGILLGMVDFPALLSIKFSFMYEAASIYGFYTNVKEERVFMLLIFQLAFSSEAHKRKILNYIKDWDKAKEDLEVINWRELQQEYRDSIDLVKLFQLAPGLGGVVGGVANYYLIGTLAETAKNSYRHRILSTHAHF
ncbi:hypothetical protein Q73_06655 [Bacillus coahuilensis m2-6]|uniref:EcsC family protein n=1 Tax=Bacillus coahuilensis TaxID=408580 RepID=UPI0007505F44|nr:EcsC family protein [Bacillus coahuilensis]KUP08407.1 hypothetical protein Q73_06655 [Bacillus coahuilensis m2-6]